MEVRTKRFLGCSCGCLAVPVVVLLSIFGAFQWWMASGRSQTASYQRQAQADGLPFTSADLIEFYRLPADKRDVTEKFVDVAKRWKEPAYEIRCKPLPIVGGGTGPKYGELFAEQDACLKLLQDHREGLDLLYSLIDDDNSCQFDINFLQGADGSIAHIEQLDAARRLVLMDGLIASRFGDAGRTTRSMLALFWMVDVVMREPSPLAQAAGATHYQEACQFLVDVLPHLEFNDEQLAALSARLKGFDSGQATRFIIYGDRALAMSIFDGPERIFDEPEKLREVQATIDADRAFFCSVMEKLHSISELPSEQRVAAATAAQEETATAMAHWRGRIGYTMSRTLLPSLRAMMILPMLAEATGVSTRVAIATERFRLRHKRLPDSLKELDIESSAIDPFTGRSIRWVRSDNRIKIYSLGANQEDDDGVQAKPNTSRNLQTMSTLDEIKAVDVGVTLQYE